MTLLYRRRQLAPWMLTLLAAGPQARAQGHVLRFATDSNDQAGLQAAARNVLKHALAALGHEVRFEALPLRRSLSMTEQGLLDGETIRVSAVTQEHPKLLRVPVPLATMEVIGYVPRGAAMPADLEALTALRVGYPRGVIALEKLLDKVPQRVEASTRQDLLRLLRMGAIDVALYASSSSAPDADPQETEGLAKLPRPLYSTPLYALLNERHQALLPRLTQVLQQMEARGEIARLRQAAWAALAAKP